MSTENAPRIITRVSIADVIPAKFLDYLHAFSHSVIVKLQGLNPLILTGVATLFYWLILSYYNSRKVRRCLYAQLLLMKFIIS
jgi:spore coat polysaccharide biosynthesis protein SpsF (cytidylyltransferase family)